MKQWGQELSDIIHRSLDHHVRVAVTGLSRAGKTAFITSLVNQLVHSSTHENLPFLHSARDGRLVGAKRVPQSNLMVPGFTYDEAADAIYSQPARWPESTRDVSEIRVAVKYRPEKRAKRLIASTQTLFIDIVDYPGEWLLDLPMLNLSYQEWSMIQMNSLHGKRKEYAQSWLDLMQGFQPDAEADEGLLAKLANEYTNYLLCCKENGLHWIQPGRFVLPGELKGAPVLQFFPLVLPQDSNEKHDKNSAYTMLENRYEEYRTKIVKLFYKQYFSSFDRQIILVDCLSPLNEGYESFMDMRTALEGIVESFQYGKTGIIGRLFAPKIDKILFAATKADHITPDQYGNLLNLLNQMVNPLWQQVAYENIARKCITMASVRATKSGHINHNNESHAAIQGVDEQQENQTIYPGEVPKKLPGPDYWARSTFDFTSFNPNIYDRNDPLPHIRVDTAMEFLLGDKLR